jgi:type IV pilus assembly protein PilN
MSINLNLLPWREAHKEQQKREFLALLGAMMACTGLLIFLVHICISKEINFQQSSNTLLNNEIKILDQKLQEIQDLQKEKEQLLARMEIIQQLQTRRPHIVHLFDVVVRTVPEGLFLSSLTRTENRVLIEGKAESNTRVSTFMRNIENSKWLKSPILSLIQANEKNTDDRWIGFNLQAIQNMEN